MEHLEDLRKVETIIKLYEYIQDNGFGMTVNGDKLSLEPPKTIDDKVAQEIVTIVKNNKSNFMNLIADPASVKENLVTVQKRTVHGNRYVLSNMDLWDRLEKIYRLIAPEDTECINGSGCDEEVLVNCKACLNEVINEKTT